MGRLHIVTLTRIALYIGTGAAGSACACYSSVDLFWTTISRPTKACALLKHTKKAQAQIMECIRCHQADHAAHTVSLGGLPSPKVTCSHRRAVPFLTGQLDAGAHERFSIALMKTLVQLGAVQ